MAITKAKKADLVAFLNEVSTQKSVLFLTTNEVEETLTSESNEEFRTEARKLGVKVREVKYSLFKLVIPA
mgnify:CR=1 FL=1